MNNLIAAPTDISTSIQSASSLGAVGSGAQSTSDGASNTAAILSFLGANGGTPYAAKLCADYEVDSQGNTPCQAGNTCYSDWFVPAGNNSTSSGQLNCLFTNRTAIGGFSNAAYWSSSESTTAPVFGSWSQNFSTGSESQNSKFSSYRLRCVRSFTP